MPNSKTPPPAAPTETAKAAPVRVKAKPAMVMDGRITMPDNAAKLMASGRARPATEIDVARAGITVPAASLKAAAALKRSRK